MEKPNILHLEKIKHFVSNLESMNIRSTGASVINYTGELYNVEGSSDDPKHIPNHEGISWKSLLEAYGINGECYVTNPGSSGSHPDFSVGGHMTANPDGSVTNGTCFLMPLCYWHNSTSRNRVAFSHTETKMLLLTGYNLGELDVTFKMRLPSPEEFSLLFYKDNQWDFRNISTDEANIIENEGLGDDIHVLIERSRQILTEGTVPKSIRTPLIKESYKLVSFNLP